MIEQKVIGWDAEFRCDTCDITDNFFTADKDFIHAYRNAHEGHEGSMTVNARLLEFDPDYVPLWGCDCCVE